MSEERDRVVREAFQAVAAEFLDLTSVEMSGSVTVHFQNGVPLSRAWELKGRMIARASAGDPESGSR